MIEERYVAEMPIRVGDQAAKGIDERDLLQILRGQQPLCAEALRAKAPTIQPSVAVKVDTVKRDGAAPTLRANAIEALGLQKHLSAELEHFGAGRADPMVSQDLRREVLRDQEICPPQSDRRVSRWRELHQDVIADGSLKKPGAEL